MRVVAPALLLTLLAIAGHPASGATPTAQARSAQLSGGQHPLILVTFVNAPSRVSGRAGTTGDHYSGSGYLVSQAAHRQAARVATAYSLREIANWPIRALAVHCVVYEIPDSRSVATVLAVLEHDPRISLAQPLQEFHTLTRSEPQPAPGSGPQSTAVATAVPPKTRAPYNDPLYDLQTNLPALDIPGAHLHSQGAGIRVALIDTGVDTAHPDLRHRVSGSHSFLTRRPVGAGSYRHGTAMAGLIAAGANNDVGIVGIAPQAQVEVYEACWQLQPGSDAAVCNTFTLAQALSAALDAHIPLVNLSIAGPSDPLLTALVETGIKRGVIFVGAAADAGDAFPTGIPGVISVGSSEHDPGRAILTAPGSHILTLRPQAQYDFESGTSVAAAEVTGVVALVLANAPHLSGSAIESLLKQTSLQAGAARRTVDSAAAVDAQAALVKVDADSGRRVASRSADSR